MKPPFSRVPAGICLLFLLLAGVPVSVEAHTPVSGHRPVIFGGPPVLSPSCRRLERSIDQIQTRLRAGYREPRGTRWRARQRSLQDEFDHKCLR